MAEPEAAPSSDPWAKFRGAAAEDPWARFRVAADSPKPSPSLLSVLADVGDQALRGINKGIVGTVTAPYGLLDWLLETGSGGRIGLPDRSEMSLYKPYLNKPEAATQAGRLAGASGEAVGASMVPMAGMLARAAQPAAAPATTTIGRIGQDAIDALRTTPGVVVGTDLASAAVSGAAAEATKEAGYSPGVQALAGMAAGVVPGVAMSYLRPTQAPIGTNTGRTLAAQRADDAAEDAAAFAAHEVRPFGPAFNQGPVASVGKQITETPIVGAPLRNNLDETMQDAATAVARTADNIAPAATPETAGIAVQRGLDRFRDRSFTELEPGTVAGMGINPMSPVQRPQGGGQAQLQRIQQGQGVLQQVTGGTVLNSRGQPVPLPQTRAQRTATRTTLEDLSDADLGTVIRTPADQTSFSTRLEALYERAFRALPPLMRQDGSRDPLLLPTSNAGGVVRAIVDDEARTGVRAGLQGRYGDMFATLANPRANIPLPTLRAMRTAIGRDLSNFGLYEASLDRTQLRRLYAALSSDIEVGLQDIAVRAAQATRMTGNRQLSVQQAQAAAQALRDLQVADRYARAGFERMDRFLQIVRQPNPQQAALQIVRGATDGGGGNMRLVRAAMSVLRQEERSEFGALVVREMGAPTAGARGIIQEVGWSPTRFVTAYQRMSPDARDLFFTPEHQQQIEQLFRIANRLANVEALANTSRSATNAINLTALGGTASSVASGDFATPLAIGGSMLGASILMSRPAYTSWMVRYLQLRADARAGTDRSVAPLMRHVGGLERMSLQNPALWPVYADVLTDVAPMEKRAQPTPKTSAAVR